MEFFGRRRVLQLVCCVRKYREMQPDRDGGASCRAQQRSRFDMKRATTGGRRQQLALASKALFAARRQTTTSDADDAVGGDDDDEQEKKNKKQQKIDSLLTAKLDGDGNARR